MVTTEAADKDVGGREMEVSSCAFDDVVLTRYMVGLWPTPGRVVAVLAAEAKDVEGNRLAVENDVAPTCAVACSWLRDVVLSTVTEP